MRTTPGRQAAAQTTGQPPEQTSGQQPAGRGDRYRWIALSNTTLSVSMATIDGSIVIIAMPAIFRGIHLNPQAPGSFSYLLWMIIGYLLVSAVLVVTLGRLGDMFGRVRIYNLGFVVFTLASIALSLDPLTGGAGAMWLIIGRMIQAFGGAMLMANSAAILTDAFPANKRGMALGINQIAGIAGQFVGLLLGGLLAAVDWRLVFWVNVPIGVFGTIWSYKRLREISATRRARLDWWGNITFAAGASLLLIAITYGIQPYGGHPTGWTSPFVDGGLIGGVLVLALFCVIETRIAEPMFALGLFKIRAFAAGNAAALLGSIARGGLQFMLIFWLQCIWLPLHGYSYHQGAAVGGHLHAAADRRVPDRRADVGIPVGQVRPAAVRDRRAADRRRRVHRPAAAPGGLPVLGVRPGDHGERAGLGAVRLAEHLGHHEQRAGPAPGGGLRHARHVPELRHVPVDRHLLLPADRGTGHGAAADPQPRAAGQGRAGRGGRARVAPAAGEHPVLVLPRLQPGAQHAGALGGAAPAAEGRRARP